MSKVTFNKDGSVTVENEEKQKESSNILKDYIAPGALTVGGIAMAAFAAAWIYYFHYELDM